MANEKPFGYVGTIPNAGAAVIKAPNQISQPSTGNKVHTGQDLRSGK